MMRFLTSSGYSTSLDEGLLSKLEKLADCFDPTCSTRFIKKVCFHRMRRCFQAMSDVNNENAEPRMVAPRMDGVSEQ